MTYRLKVMHDESPESPREWDNLGTFVGWHSRYAIGDRQPSADPADYTAALPKDEIVLGVYMIEHGGVLYSTQPFGCPWDSGQVGYIHCSPSNPEAEGMTREAIVEALAAEVVTYSQWASGGVYGFILEEWLPAECGNESHGTWRSADSCWGFYGTDWANNGVECALPEDARALLEGIEIS
jgi:hypothetical protein